MILGMDDFNRGPAATLGPNWTEQNGGPLGINSDFAITAAGQATIGVGASGNVMCATMNGTTHTVVGINCWIKRHAVTNPTTTCGLVWRFNDTLNFYYAIIYFGALPAQTDSLLIVRVAGGVQTPLFNHGIGVSGWRPFGTTLERISIQHDADNRISVYAGGVYYIGNVGNWHEGTIGAVTDLAPMILPGTAGLFTTANQAGSEGGMLWDGFICSDLQPETVYVDVNAPTGEAMGIAGSPDPGLHYALNNALIHRGGTIRFVDGQPTITNAGVAPDATSIANYVVGHDYKFAAEGGESFPTYSPEDGTELTTGAPNLTIEAADGDRTLLRETRNVSFITMRGFASWLLVRGFDFETSNNNVSRLIGTLSTNNIGAPAEHSVVVDKCDLLGTINGGDQLLRYAHSGDFVGARYCNFRLSPGVAHDQFVVIGSTSGAIMRNADFSFCVCKGSTTSVFQLTGTVPAGGVHDYAHTTCVDIESGVATTSILEITDAANVLGDIVFRDHIIASRGANPTDFGIRIIANAPAGTITRHHNAYQGVVTPASAGVTDGGNELTADPQFVDEAAAYSWFQTAGSPALVLASDLRPTNALLKEMASDSWLGVFLDRGALQVIIIPPPPPGPRMRTRPDVCVRVTYDPAGRAIDLSNRLLVLRPIKQDKDVRLQQYRLSDTHVDVIDGEGLFIESSSASIITDSGGAPNWFGTPVAIDAYDDAGVLFSYVGYLIGIVNDRAKTTLHLGNRFTTLFKARPLANDAGRIETTSNDTAVAGVSVPAAGSYLSDITPNAGCGVETWTFRFLNATQFQLFGSVTGLDGSGDRTVDFTSDSGAITALAADWVNDGGDPFAADDEVTIKTVYVFAATRTVDAFEELLTSAFLADLPAAMVDDSVASFRNTIIDQDLAPRFVIDDDSVTLLELIEQLGRHMLAVGIEKTDGRIGLSAYVPRLQDRRSLPVLCKHTDLMDASIDRSDVYNVFTFDYDYDEANERFAERLTVIDTLANRELHGTRPSASTIELKGFTDANQVWVQSMGEQSLVRWGIPRPAPDVTLNRSRMAIEIDEYFRLDSHHPTVALFVEPASISRHLTPEPRIESEMIDVSFYLQFEGDCGFMFHDAGHRHDDCWIHF